MCTQLWIGTLLVILARKHVCSGHGYANKVSGIMSEVNGPPCTTFAPIQLVHIYIHLDNHEKSLYQFINMSLLSDLVLEK